ncbi:MAG: biotin--[acetyl-CoA-carboxylase] ligase [Methanomicrobiales archaeon]|nr:biotin--[acetyl-CoA-carboxylase] ligase [Methanomicrobiales archaeon]MDI6876551.1 biotin--[acetyl-CoA-carboxylase] ligase [Methanomicrobiales archaeon]
MNESAFAVLEILDRSDRPMHDDEIAAALGVPLSRVRADIQELQRLGYDFALTEKGYRVRMRSSRLLPYEVQKVLTTQFIGREMLYCERTASTTWIGKQVMAEEDPARHHGMVIIAEEQTGGTGRLGRAWISPPGGIWITIVLHPKIPIDRVFMVTMAGSVAVARAIRKEFDIGALIKWPNDILVGDKKIAGLLVELASEGETIHYCLLGIGIDANIPIMELTPGLRQSATSLSAELGHDVDRPAFLAAVLKEFERHYLLLESGEYDTIIREWKSLSSTLEHRVRIRTHTRHFEGEAIDIDDHGALIVRRDNGAVERVIAGDCHLL